MPPRNRPTAFEISFPDEPVQSSQPVASGSGRSYDFKRKGVQLTDDRVSNLDNGQ